MWIQWGADIIILLGVLLLWKVLLPDNNEKWKIKLFGHFTLPIRWLQLAGSFTLLAIFVGFIEISKTDLHQRLLHNSSYSCYRGNCALDYIQKVAQSPSKDQKAKQASY